MLRRLLLPPLTILVAARFTFAADAADGDLPPCRSGNAASNLTCWGSFGAKVGCAKEANACFLRVTTVIADPSRVTATGGCAYPGDQKNSTKIHPLGTYNLPKLLREETTYCQSDLCNVLPKDTESIQCNFNTAAPNATQTLSCGLDYTHISYNKLTKLYELEKPTCQSRRRTNLTSGEWVVKGTCSWADRPRRNSGYYCRVGEVLNTGDGVEYTTTACCSSGNRCNEIPEPRTSKGVLSCFSGTSTLPCNFDQDECWTYRDIKKDGGVITVSDCYRRGEFGMLPKCALGNRTIYHGTIRETTTCCSTPNCNTPTCTNTPTATTVV